MKPCLRCGTVLETGGVSLSGVPLLLCTACGETYHRTIVETAPGEMWDALLQHREVMLDDGSKLLVDLSGEQLLFVRQYPSTRLPKECC